MQKSNIETLGDIQNIGFQIRKLVSDVIEVHTIQNPEMIPLANINSSHIDTVCFKECYDESTTHYQLYYNNQLLFSDIDLSTIADLFSTLEYKEYMFQNTLSV